MVSLLELQDALEQFVVSNSEMIFPAVFLSVFVFAAVAIKYKGQYRLIFVVFLVVMITTSATLAIAVYPFTHAHRYSSVSEDVEQEYDIRFVDESGNEIFADPRAVSPTRTDILAEYIVENMTHKERVEIAAFLLEEASEYRSRVESPWPAVRHPPSRAGHIWSRSSLEPYDEFTSVRIYHVTWTYESESPHVENKIENCVIELHPETRTVTDGCNYV